MQQPANGRLEVELGTAKKPRPDATDTSKAARTVEERKPLVKPSAANPSGGGSSILQRIMLDIDERVSVKLLMRVWGPRLELVVRLMLVATFIDDSLRMGMHFAEHMEQVGQGWCLKWLAAASPALRSAVTSILLGSGLLAQSLGSISLIALFKSDIAIKALIGWTVAQPVLYSQLSNMEFMSESVSLIGGLLMLYVHLVFKEEHEGTSSPGNENLPTTSNEVSAMTQLIGRLLLPTAYIYRAGIFLSTALTLDETSNLATYLSSLSMFVINIVVLVGLVIGSVLVATGLKSRTVALLLALVNLGFVFYQHPFFRFVYHEGGEWKVNEDAMWLPNFALPKDATLEFEFDPWDIYDLHRYYFFLGLSTSGALLLLAQFGPGEIAVQKDEVLIPDLERAHD